ncbi:hypothetical protein [Nocardia colli]|uniref:hypothetical protein n=1 Tax=Nocardia colli TaxID=2545717 RepID=UPI0035D60E28
MQLHRHRRRHPLHSSEIDCRRAELVADINTWLVDGETAHAPVTEWPESVSALLDRMAAAAARALDKLVDKGPSDLATRDAWARLAALEHEYERITVATAAPLAG